MHFLLGLLLHLPRLLLALLGTFFVFAAAFLLLLTGLLHLLTCFLHFLLCLFAFLLQLLHRLLLGLIILACILFHLGQFLQVFLHIFHLLQTVSENTIDLDVGVPSRGWHGEAYRGHILWDELFIFPFLNLRLPELTRSLLMYRYRRLEEARHLARQAGHRGAMFPWQSGSDGREESQVLHLNPRSGRWVPDESNLQRHVSAAIAYNVWQYHQATQDVEFLAHYGAEMLLSIARFWASIATFDPERERYEIRGVAGPDEYHTNVVMAVLADRGATLLDAPFPLGDPMHKVKVSMGAPPLAVDIDGTLTGADGRLDAATFAAMERLAAAGLTGATISSNTPFSSACRASGRLLALPWPSSSRNRLQLETRTVGPGCRSVIPTSPSTPAGASCGGTTSLTTSTWTPGMMRTMADVSSGF